MLMVANPLRPHVATIADYASHFGFIALSLGKRQICVRKVNKHRIAACRDPSRGSNSQEGATHMYGM